MILSSNYIIISLYIINAKCIFDKIKINRKGIIVMAKTKIATRILSCLLVLTLLLTSVVTSVSFTKESDKNPVYKLKQVNYSQEIPLKWRFTNSSGYTYTKTLTTHYFRGASPDTPNVYDIIAYCMDWGVQGPSSSGSTYDHPTTTITQEKINQLTYVLMNGYSGGDSANAKNNTFTFN